MPSRLVVAVLLFISASACAAERDTAGIVASRAEGYRIQFPEKPSHSTRVIGKEATPDKHHMLTVSRPDGVLMLAFQNSTTASRNPDDEKMHLAAILKFQSAIRGQATKYEKIRQGDFIGREVHFQIPLKSGASRSRMYFANGKWFHVFAMGTPDFIESELARDFLESFRLHAPEETEKN